MTPEQKALAVAVAAELNLQPTPGYDDHWGPVFAAGWREALLLLGSAAWAVTHIRQRGKQLA